MCAPFCKFRDPPLDLNNKNFQISRKTVTATDFITNVALSGWVTAERTKIDAKMISVTF